MKKLITLALCFVLLCVVLAFTVSAAEVTVAYEGDTVIMTVPFGATNANAEAVGKLFHPGKTQADLVSDNSNFTEVFAGFVQTTADENGTATFTFEVDGAAGYYTASFTTKKTAKAPIEKSFPFAPDRAVSALIISLCNLPYDATENADNAEAIATVAGLFDVVEDGLSGAEILGIIGSGEAYTTYEGMEPAEQDVIHEMFLCELSKLPCNTEANPQEIPSKNDILATFAKCIDIYNFFAETDMEVVTATLLEEAEFFGLAGTECFEKLFVPKTAEDATEIDKEIVSAAVSALFDADLTIAETCDFVDVFSEFIFMSAVTHNVTDGDVGNVMEAVPNYLEEIGIENYDKATNKGEVWGALAPIKNLEDFVSVANRTISTRTQTSSSSSSSSGSGSGRGSSNRGSGTASGVTAAQTTLPVELDVFGDLGSVAWAKESILSLADQGILNGKEPGKFYPGDDIKREEFAKVLVLAFNLSGESEASFTDVDKAAWYYEYVTKACGSGAINGQGETFGIGQSLTRQDMAVMIGRILEDMMEMPAVSEPNFADNNSISDYAKKYVACLNELGFVSGVGDGNFEPLRSVTRAEVAKVVDSVMKEVASK